jgi:glycosyltransferase involved in cell wall biosynthesis
MGQDAEVKPFYRLLINDSIRLITLSKDAAQRVKQSTGFNAEIIPFGLPADWTIRSNRSRDVHILSVGSIIPLKNHLFLLKTVRQLVMHFPKLKVVIIGEHHDQYLVKSIQRFIEDHALQSCVQLIDKLPRNEIRNWMDRAMVLVHPSLSESQGVVISEALARGCLVYSLGAGERPEHPSFFLLKEEIGEATTQLINALTNPLYSEGSTRHISETYQAYMKGF